MTAAALSVMKRTLVPMLAIAMLTAGNAAADRSGDPARLGPQRTLSGEEVTRYALPHLPRVARCYRKHAMSARKATGDLALYLVIAPNGKVLHSEVTAPGVLPRRLGRLTRCVRDEAWWWRFPARAGITNAVIPYYFLHTQAPASGAPDREPRPRRI
jgi:hypothetical protein